MPRAGGDQWPGSTSQTEREFELFLLFYSIQALGGLEDAHHHW